jgi:hypothetical protein
MKPYILNSESQNHSEAIPASQVPSSQILNSSEKENIPSGNLLPANSSSTSTNLLHFSKMSQSDCIKLEQPHGPPSPAHNPIPSPQSIPNLTPINISTSNLHLEDLTLTLLSSHNISLPALSHSTTSFTNHILKYTSSIIQSSQIITIVASLPAIPESIVIQTSIFVFDTPELKLEGCNVNLCSDIIVVNE